MKIIDKNETETWLANHNLLNSNGKLLNQHGKISIGGYLEPLLFWIPVDSHAKTHISTDLMSYFNDEHESLLWINEFGIWQSAEDWFLFVGFRKSLGENATLWDKPGHIFTNTDFDAVRSLVSLVLYFYCGAFIVSPTKNLIVRISHDEFIEVYAKDKNLLSEIQAHLKEWTDSSPSE